MGVIFQPAGSAGRVPEVQRFELAAAQTFKAGALVLVNSSGLLAECGADPTAITGVALQDANTGPGNNAADSPTVITGRSNEVSVALANRNNIFSGRAVNGGTDPVTPLQTHIGEQYGVLKTGAGEWVIDMAEVTTKSIEIVDIDLTGTNKFFFKFIEAFLDQP